MKQFILIALFLMFGISAANAQTRHLSPDKNFVGDLADNGLDSNAVVSDKTNAAKTLALSPQKTIPAKEAVKTGEEGKAKTENTGSKTSATDKQTQVLSDKKELPVKKEMAPEKKKKE